MAWVGRAILKITLPHLSRWRFQFYYAHVKRVFPTVQTILSTLYSFQLIWQQVQGILGTVR